MKASDLGDYTSYYCSCHLFSLAPGMVAMATAHSRPIGGDPAVLCISWCARDEGSSSRGKDLRDEARSLFRLQVPNPFHSPPFPPALFNHHRAPA